MRQPESFLGQPIRSLQTMLRVIAKADPSHISVIPDGIYGPETMRAVSDFQRRHGLPVTGITNQATWEEIVAVYTPALVELDPAQPIQVVFNPGQVIRRGQQHPNVYLAQGMLTVLSLTYKSVAKPSLSGILDGLTADSLETFQALSALPMTGNLDRQTWRHLALQYPLAANLQNVSNL